jgi:hypothetical protein
MFPLILSVDDRKGSLWPRGSAHDSMVSYNTGLCAFFCHRPVNHCVFNHVWMTHSWAGQGEVCHAAQAWLGISPKQIRRTHSRGNLPVRDSRNICMNKAVPLIPLVLAKLSAARSREGSKSKSSFLPQKHQKGISKACRPFHTVLTRRALFLESSTLTSSALQARAIY